MELHPRPQGPPANAVVWPSHEAHSFRVSEQQLPPRKDEALPTPLNPSAP